jgi:secreted trypsin-like serine protease
VTLGRSRSGGIFRREDAESAEAEVEGSCFGESGGPILYDSSDVILGVNSFVINGQCAGVGFAYRVDQQDVIDWIQANAKGDVNVVTVS